MSGTAQAALIAAVAQLRAAGIEDPAADARLLLADALRLPPGRLTMVIRDPISPEAAARFADHLRQRLTRRPVSQIIGTRQFWGHSFRVTSDTLDPRPETEILVAEALRQPFARVLDLGTGTGCILLSCLVAVPEAQGLGIDSSAAALDVSRSNAEALALSARVRWDQRSWLDPDWTQGLGRFDLILSNPPYIAADEMPGLAPEVRLWEPYQALSPGGDGLDAYRSIAAAAPLLLQPSGRLLFEIGPTQASAVSALLRAAGLQAVQVIQDLDGRDRVVMGRAGD